MSPIEPSSTVELDELAQLEIAIARRADDLTRTHHSADETPDFWRQAEQEIWSARERALEAAAAA